MGFFDDQGALDGESDLIGKGLQNLVQVARPSGLGQDEHAMNAPGGDKGKMERSSFWEHVGPRARRFSVEIGPMTHLQLGRRQCR